MPPPKLSRLEFQVMDVLWTAPGPLAIREIQEAIPPKRRPAYTTVQTLVNRLEAKKAVRRVKKIGSAHIYEAAVSRSSAQGRLVDEFLALFGGGMQPLMTHFIEAGKLSLADVQDAEKRLKELAKKDSIGKGRKP